MGKNFDAVYKERANAVETALDKYVTLKNNYQSEIYEAMRYSLLGGGKRLRGILCLTGGLLAGGTEKDVMPFACAMEMIHTYSLIHDDLPAMDNDDMRRGKPTCHKKYGEATAILAGDALLNGAFELMLKSKVKEGDILKAIEIIASASGTEGMIGGQMVDLMCEGKEISKDLLLYLHRHKTGALISAALLSGYVACGGGTEKDMAALKEYAEKIGLAFQVIDDILDITGDEKTLGKPIGSDNKNHKNTFIGFMGLDGSKKFAKDLSIEAAEAVKDFGEEGKFLAWLAEYLCDRKF